MQAILFSILALCFDLFYTDQVVNHIFTSLFNLYKYCKVKSYETHSAVKRPNAIFSKRMRSATDKSKINSGCMQKHTREKKCALFL